MAGDKAESEALLNKSAKSASAKRRRASVSLEMESGQLSTKETGDGLQDGDLQTYPMATIKWFAHPDSHVHDAAFMFSVSGELFFFMLVIAWAMTIYFTPDTLNSNALRDVVGYNNVCVGLDMPPALWVAATSYGLVSYFQIQYCVYFFERYHLEKETGTSKMPWLMDKLMYAAHWLFLIISGVFALCFVNHPWDGVKAHTYPFIAYMWGRLIICWSIYIDDAYQTVPHIGGKKSAVICYTYLIVITAITIFLPMFWLERIDAKDVWRAANPSSPDSDFPMLVNPWIPFIVDYGWLALIGCQANFLPERPVVIIGGGQLVDLKTIRDTNEVFAFEKNMTRQRAFHGILSYYEKLPIHKKGNRAKHNWMRLLSSYSRFLQKEEPVHALEVVNHASIVRYFKKEGSNPREACVSNGWNVITLHCTLTIDDRTTTALPYFMQTGLFAKTGSYKGIMRINAINGGIARVSMRFNVPANDHDLRVLDEAAPTAYPDQFNQIDFLMAEDFKTFPFETLDELNKAMKLKNEPSLWDLILHFFGQHGYLQSIKNFVKVAYSNISDNTKGIVGKNFYGALPYLAGKHSAVKWGIQAKQDHPLRPEQILGGKKLKNYETEGKEVEAAEKHLAALKEWMGEHPEGAKWDFVVQPAKDFDEMNIEVAKFGWSEKESPYMPVGTIHIHKQDIELSNFSALNL